MAINAGVSTRPSVDLRDHENDLRRLAAWIAHWREDKQCNLAPTDGSLDDAAARINKMLGRLM